MAEKAPERTVELDQPVLFDETQNAIQQATDRAERAEAELARLKAHPPPAAAKPASSAAKSTPAAAKPTPSAAKPEAPTATSDRTEVTADDLKQPPSPNTAANASPDTTTAAPTERGSADEGGLDELRKDPMMAHLLDSLDAGTDVGHYGRLTFSMVARHFLPHEEVTAWLMKDKDCSEDQAQQMLHQVEGRDYSPPRRERLLQWQKEQEFQFIDAHDPDSGNLYRNLKFPQEIYDHIGHYQEAKAAE